MKTKVKFAIFTLFIHSIISCSLFNYHFNEQDNKYPVTREEQLYEQIHGINVYDPYRWLEGETEEVSEWVRNENTYARTILDKLPQRVKIRKRLKELYYTDTVGIPVVRGNRYFFTERHGNEELPVLYVQDGLNSIPKVLIDQNSLSRDNSVSISNWSPSRDGKLLAYQLSSSGKDASTIQLIEVDTKKILSDKISEDGYPHFNGWDVDGKGFWYVKSASDTPQNEKKYHKRIFYHKIGEDFTQPEAEPDQGMRQGVLNYPRKKEYLVDKGSNQDKIFYGENLYKEDYPYIDDISDDGRFLLINVAIYSQGKEKNELYLFDRSSNNIYSIIKNLDGIFNGTIYGNKIFIFTNYNAPLNKIIVADIADLINGKNEPKDLILEKEYTIADFRIVSDRIFIQSLENVVSNLKIYDLDGTYLSEVLLPSLGSVYYLSAERNGRELFFAYSSLNIPNTIYRCDIKNNSCKIFKESNLKIDRDNFIVKQEWFKSQDGTKVPMFIMHRRGLKLDGNNPTLLYGYGGFNINEIPYFRSNAIMFAENGGVYAMVNLRGGGEFGEKWHEAGIFDKKQNVFDDFIAASEYLIKSGYTNNKKLGIYGWSNGGLLTAAVLGQRPELFRAAIIGAPVADMLRFHKFHGGRYWISEYGDPDKKEHFDFLYKYSPYHNAKNGTKYPATLILTAESDDRVHPMHAFKMAARLQKANQSNNPILLRVEEKAGHGGATSLSRGLEVAVDTFSFLFWQLY